MLPSTNRIRTQSKSLTHRFAMRSALLTAISLIICLLPATQPTTGYVKSSSAVIRVHATSQGKPLLNLQEASQSNIDYQGSAVATEALRSGSARPLSLASGDLDADGAADLVSGYGYGDIGMIAIRRGNLGAFQTQDPNVYQRALKGEVAAGVLSRADVYQVPQAPNFLAVADFDGDGYPDVLAATIGGGLYLLAGDGSGSLLGAEQIGLTGKITAIAAGTFNRGSERLSLVVGIDGQGGPALLVFEGQDGGLHSQPKRYPLSSVATVLALGRLDNDSFTDVAIGLGNQVEIIHGGGWNNSDPDSRIERIDVPFEIRSLAIGDFIWDRDFRSELALLSPDGNVHLYAQGQLDTRPFTEADKPALYARRVAAARQPLLTFEQQKAIQEQSKWDPSAKEAWSDAQQFVAVSASGNLSAQTLMTGSHTTGRRTDDLFALDAQAQQVHILVDTSTVTEPWNPRVPVTLDVDGSPLTVVAMPQKINASRDLLVLSSAHSEAGAIVLAPQANFTVTQTADRNSTCGTGGICSLREAINAANAAAGTNVILFSVNGTFTNTLGQFPAQGDVNSNNITIMGSSPANTVIANTGSGVGHSVLYYGFNANQTFKVQNLTLQNGNTADGFGGGALATGGTGWTVTVDNCVMNNNVSQSTDNGGAISQSGGGNFIIQNNSVLSNNTATAAIGGGICVNNSTNVGGLTITNSSFTGNTATAGAGAGQGGGIWIGVESSGSSVVTITRATITGNAAGSQQGGGIFTNKGTIQFSRIVGNTAVTGGTGIFEPAGGFAVTANNNWWGCNTGPNGAATGGCSVAPNTTSGFTAPTAWLQLRNVISGANVHNANQIAPGSNATFSGDILGLNTGGTTPAANLTGLLTFPSAVSTIYSNSSPALASSFNPTTGQYVNGVASTSAIFVSNSTKGIATVNSIADNQTFAAQLLIGFTPVFVNSTGSDATPFASAACGGGANVPCYATMGVAITNVALTDLALVAGVINIQTGGYAESPNFNQGSTVNITATVSNTGSFTFTNGTINANANSISLTGDWTNNGSTFNQGTSTVTFNGSGAENLNGSAGTQTFNNLIVNKGSSSTLTVGGTTTTLNINGTLTLSAGTFAAGTASAINVGGNWTNNVGPTAFTPGSGTVTFNSTAAGQTIGGTAASQTFNNLTVSKSGQILNTGGSTTQLDLNGNFNLTAGTFTAPATLNVAGDWTEATGTTFTPGTGTVTFNGTGARSLTGTAATQTFNNFVINKTGGGSVTGVSSTTGLTINGGVTLTAGTFSAGSITAIGIAGDWQNDGATFTPGSSVVTFNSTTAAQTIKGTAATQTFNSITVNKTGQVLNVSGSTTTLNLNGTMNITAGNFNVNTASNVNVGGDWTLALAATFTPGSGTNTVTFNGAGAQNLNGTATSEAFNNFTVNKSAGTLSGGGSLATLTVNKDFTITLGAFAPGATLLTINESGGNWSNSGTFTAGTGTVIFNANAVGQTLSGNTSFNNLTINHTGAGNVDASGSTLAVTGLLRVQAGTFISASTFNNVQIDSGQTLQGTNATTMNVSGNWTNNSGTFTPNGNTVNFNGAGAQSISGSATTQTFNNFTVNKSGGTLSLAASTTTLTITGTVTLTAGTFDKGTATTINVAGNWANNGGAFTAGLGTVNFNGGAGQTISGTTATTFNNLTNSDVGGISMTNDNTVNAILALTSGDITVAATKTLTQPVAGTSSGAFDVNGRVQRNGFVSAACATAPCANTLSFGNPNNQITVTAGTAPANIVVDLARSVPTGFANAVQRTYTITPSAGAFTGTLRLHYLDSELNGNTKAGLIFRRFNGTGWAPVTPSAFDNTANLSWLEKSGVTTFSPWTFNSTFSPTASNGSVSGSITDANGVPVAGAVINLTGGQSRKTITDANGNYHFDNVETDAFYTVTPSRANYNFSPTTRSFSQIGNKTEAAFTATSSGDSVNPLDTAEYFVRQQYVDVLGREPDESGFNYWSDQILACGADASCVNTHRRDVAAAFFIAEEFQQTGSFIYGFYKGAFGRRPAFSEYSTDRTQVVGGANLEAEKATFANNFVQRAEFVAKYQANASADSFVDALIQTVQTSGVDLSGARASLISVYNGGGSTVESRALVVRAIADDATFKQSQYNQAFVLTEYFNYLRRDPDQVGYDFWLNVLNNGDVGNYRGMVCSFITSTEYQRRFSGVVSHSNSECAR